MSSKEHCELYTLLYRCLH